MQDVISAGYEQCCWPAEAILEVSPGVATSPMLAAGHQQTLLGGLLSLETLMPADGQLRGSAAFLSADAVGKAEEDMAVEPSCAALLTDPALAGSPASAISTVEWPGPCGAEEEGPQSGVPPGAQGSSLLGAARSSVLDPSQVLLRQAWTPSTMLIPTQQQIMVPSALRHQGSTGSLAGEECGMPAAWPGADSGSSSNLLAAQPAQSSACGSNDSLILSAWSASSHDLTAQGLTCPPADLPSTPPPQAHTAGEAAEGGGEEQDPSDPDYSPAMEAVAPASHWSGAEGDLEPRADQARQRRPSALSRRDDFMEASDSDEELRAGQSSGFGARRPRQGGAAKSLTHSDDDTDTDEEGKVRRKHHNPWSVEETKTLVIGVEACGGGKWADIKKRGYRAIENRSAVDLKDKWRNLMRVAVLPPHQLKTKCLKRREVPQELLDRVRELSALMANTKKGGSRRRSTARAGRSGGRSRR